MNKIYYLYEEHWGGWVKLKYLPEESGLGDEFEVMETKTKFIKAGQRLDMYYGSMTKLIEKEQLLTEEKWKITNE